MKALNKHQHTPIILSVACVFVIPFNIVELYIYFRIGIFEPYTYIMAIIPGILSFLLIQIAIAIALYRWRWSKINSALLLVWLSNIGIFGMMLLNQNK
jgi:hypothetical protein